jgi:hypothetical protein
MYLAWQKGDDMMYHAWQKRDNMNTYRKFSYEI